MADSKPSRSARKRDQQALQELGERLIELLDKDLDGIPIDDALREAVRMAKRIRSHGALRRQKQLIGRLMRQNDAAAIRASLETITRGTVADKRLFADAERWRDRIVEQGTPGLRAFRRETGCEDDDLDRLLDDLRRASTERMRKTLRREIFRAVNDVLVAQRTDDRIPR